MTHPLSVLAHGARRVGRVRRVGVLGVGLTVASLLAGCSSGPSLNEVANNRGYVVGNGQIEKLPVERRSAPVTFSGVTLDGKPWSMADAAGKVIVVNIWGSWCPPCEQEMPDLQKAYSELMTATAPVAFIGVNVGESAQTGGPAAARYGLTFPSLSDEAGATRLAFAGMAEATPVTLILDRSGRVAARVNGPIPSATTLRELVTDVVNERA